MTKNSLVKKIMACGLVAGMVFALSSTVLPEKYAAGIGLVNQTEAAEAAKDDDGYYCPGPRNGRGRRWRGGCCGRYNGQDAPCWVEGDNKD